MNQKIVDAAYKVAAEVVATGKDANERYKVPIGDQNLYISSDRALIVGPDTIRIGETVFYLGFCRKATN